MNTKVIVLATALALLLPVPATAMSITCNTRLLQYYGLEGLSHAIPYSVMEQINSDDFCPNLHQTCCTSEDFNLTRELWAENSLKIKGYLTQIFRVLQKVATIQSSLIQFMPKIQSKNTAACKKIDSTFFNSPIKFDEIHFYIRNALEAFAYIQKGFYCMICDPLQHSFFQRKINYGRFFVQMSQKSCDDLVFFFREFLAYKVYFFNPLIKNMNQVLNCVHDTDIEYFDYQNLVSYQGIADCLENKNYCWKVCKEFRFGISSNLFIGQLREYKKLLNSIEDIVAEMSHQTKKFDELDFLDEDFSGEFFARTNDTIVMNNMNLLKDMNLSKAELLFTEDGLDLFYIAVGSNYFLTDASTLNNVKRHYEITKPNQDDNTVLDPTVNKPVDGYNVAPDLANTRTEIDLTNGAKKPPSVDGHDGSGTTQPNNDAAGGPPIQANTDELEKQYFDKLAKENPADPVIDTAHGNGTAKVTRKLAGSSGIISSLIALFGTLALTGFN